MKDTPGTPLHYKSNNKFEVNRFHYLERTTKSIAVELSYKLIKRQSLVPNAVKIIKRVILVTQLQLKFNHTSSKRLVNPEKVP